MKSKLDTIHLTYLLLFSTCSFACEKNTAITPEFNVDDTISVDFGSPFFLTTDHGWQNIDNPTDDNPYYLVNQDCFPTDITLTISKPFHGIDTSGHGVIPLPFPMSATQDAFFVSAAEFENRQNTSAQMILSGLNPDDAYNLTLFASHEGHDDLHYHVGQYSLQEVDDQSHYVMTLDASNSDEPTHKDALKTRLNRIRPNDSGEITIDIRVSSKKNSNLSNPDDTKKRRSRFAYLGGLQLTKTMAGPQALAERDLQTDLNRSLLQSMQTIPAQDSTIKLFGSNCIKAPDDAQPLYPVGHENSENDTLILDQVAINRLYEEGKRNFKLIDAVYRITDGIVPPKGTAFYGNFDNDCQPTSIVRGSIAILPAQETPPALSLSQAPPVHWQRVEINKRDLYVADLSHLLKDRTLYHSNNRCAKDKNKQFINPGCYLAEDLLLFHKDSTTPENNLALTKWLMHQPDLDKIAPGSWHLDYTKKKAYLTPEDYQPDVFNYELSIAPSAFQHYHHDGLFSGYYKPNPWIKAKKDDNNNKIPIAENNNVAIKGLIIENFATAVGHGAIGGQWPPAGWRVEHNIVRHSHSSGIKVGAEAVIRFNQVYGNGQMGIEGGYSIHSLVDANEIYNNNLAFFSQGFAAGGAKFTNAYDLRVTRNCVYDNRGPGLWTDVSAEQVVYQWNVAHHNTGAGIFHEISLEASIRENQIGYNSLPYTNPLPHPKADAQPQGQIYVASSQNTEVLGNHLIEPSGAGGASVHVSWNTERGRVWRFPQPLINDSGQLLPRVAEMSSSRHNRIEDNQFYTLGTSDHDLFIMLDGKQNYNHSAFEAETTIDNNDYHGPVATKHAYRWKINRHSNHKHGWSRVNLINNDEPSLFGLRQLINTLDQPLYYENTHSEIPYSQIDALPTWDWGCASAVSHLEKTSSNQF